ncbi:exosortase [Sphingomonas vulcanisoli]|uniref:Exosortase n=1 Tax=Sphingomonas vulcanisoli TaxID=1658060 RepID=A0ABX0TWS5_9SPHN|nr:archaeosortase/exosortase family protein [Sphingomonas vulcanisoli]NIJ08066.1 exosortase [Sphingomonas vulcanisoli]
MIAAGGGDLRREKDWLPLALLGAGLALLLTPFAIDMFEQFWAAGKNGQAPVVLIAAGYAYWINRDLFAHPGSRRDRRLGYAAIVLAWISFVLGRAGAFYQLEGLAVPLIALGLTLVLGGAAALRRMALINILLLAVVPLPGSLADAVLVPLKEFITRGVVELLARLGYPVAVNGVVISIGFVELQIADACSGLWSMVSLVAIGLLYLFFLPCSTRRASLLFLLAVVPLALFTNFIRVLSLVLIAYHGGTAREAQVHDAAAYLEVALSLLLFALAHAAIERLAGRRHA